MGCEVLHLTVREQVTWKDEVMDGCMYAWRNGRVDVTPSTPTARSSLRFGKNPHMRKPHL